MTDREKCIGLERAKRIRKAFSEANIPLADFPVDISACISLDKMAKLEIEPNSKLTTTDEMYTFREYVWLVMILIEGEKVRVTTFNSKSPGVYFTVEISI